MLSDAHIITSHHSVRDIPFPSLSPQNTQLSCCLHQRQTAYYVWRPNIRSVTEPFFSNLLRQGLWIYWRGHLTTPYKLQVLPDEKYMYNVTLNYQTNQVWCVCGCVSCLNLRSTCLTHRWVTYAICVRMPPSILDLLYLSHHILVHITLIHSYHVWHLLVSLGQQKTHISSLNTYPF